MRDMRDNEEQLRDALKCVPVVIARLNDDVTISMFGEIMQACIDVGYHDGYEDGRKKRKE